MTTVQTILFHAHSGLRWLVVLMTLVAFVWLLVGMIQTRPYDKNTHRVMVAFSSLIGLQWLLGIILFVAMGRFDVAARWEHAVTMTAALVLAHMYIPFKKRHDIARYRAGLMIIVGVMVLIFVGVARLPQGWMG